MIKKIISGGQTGADQAALDAAIRLGIPHGGSIPKGRINEDGRLSDKYQLKEMSTSSYPRRTEQNVIDSDGTLIVSHGKLTGGSVYTKEMAVKRNKPCPHSDLNKTNLFQEGDFIADWVNLNRIKTLNVAGPSASKDPRIYQDVINLLEIVIRVK